MPRCHYWRASALPGGWRRGAWADIRTAQSCPWGIAYRDRWRDAWRELNHPRGLTPRLRSPRHLCRLRAPAQPLPAASPHPCCRPAPRAPQIRPRSPPPPLSRRRGGRSRLHASSAQLSRFDKLPRIGGTGGFGVQRKMLVSRLAHKLSGLPRHPRRIMLQEINQVDIQANPRGVELVGVRLLRTGFGLIRRLRARYVPTSVE